LITIPSSHVEKPPTLCPPLRTATTRAWSRANRIAEITSSTPATRAMSAGRLSITPFHTSRAVS